MKAWWLKCEQRLSDEREAVENIGQGDGWFRLDGWKLDGSRLCASGVISAHGHDYAIRLIYPDQFPLVPAWVEPQEDVRWSTHQYGSGTLCLQLRPDNWTPEATGADVLRSAYELLLIENPSGGGETRAPTAHHNTEAQAYNWFEGPAFVGRGCINRLLLGTARELKAIRWRSEDETWPILLHDEEDRLDPRKAPGEDAASSRIELVVLRSGNAAPSGDVTREKLFEAGELDLLMATILTTSDAVVVFSGGGKLEMFHLPAQAGPFRRHIYPLNDDTGARSARKPEAAGKKVAVVGLGSVGSKVAESLLRSGVTELTLIDGDVFLPENLERHALDWRDVGFKKANGLKRRLLQIVPRADLIVLTNNLNWQRSAKTHASETELISANDVIINATGDAATGLFLAAVAEANGRAFVSVEVFEGGIGALVATVIPDRDPPFATGRAAFLAWCDVQGVKAPEQGQQAYEALSADGVPITADDAAVTMTAGNASRVVLDILDGHPAPSQSAWLLLGYRKEWLFDGHGHTIRLDVGQRAGPADNPINEDSRKFVVQLIEEATNAAQPVA